MIRALIILVLLFVAPCSHAQKQEGNTGDQKSITIPQKDDQDTESEPPVVTPWPQPFQPSQEVGADSQVSFPADI